MNYSLKNIWNTDIDSVGIQGPQGYQGIPGGGSGGGTTGPQGSQGYQGLQGPQGNQGINGSQGNQGPQGYQGASLVTTTTNDVIVSGSGSIVDSGINLSSFVIPQYSNINPTLSAIGSSPSPSSITILIQFTKLGNLVMCNISPMDQAMSGVNSFKGSAIIPSGYRPTFNYEFDFAALENGNYDPGASGGVFINTSGDLQIFRDVSNTQAWGDVSCGWNGISFCYYS